MGIAVKKKEVIEETKSSSNIRCSVCVSTYQRPHLLEKLLVSLKNQVIPDGVELEVIVVDNDAHRSAEAIFQKFQSSRTIHLSYYNQPLKNISITRNLGVEKASGEYILFIDDDEVASPKWMYYLFKAMKKYNADGVFGPVLPEFERETPDWMWQEYFFYKKIPNTGTKATLKYTGNCIVVASLLKKMSKPFDPKFGITGGEDAHLFDRLQLQGARFVYCREAWVSEFVPLNRARFIYFFLRRMRGGNVHTRRIIEFAGKKKIFMRPLMVAKALTFGIISLFLMVCQFSNSVRRNKWLMKCAANIGRFLAAIGFHYQSYR
jgi:succinoglycan biosynthesis protein ExoM